MPEIPDTTVNFDTVAILLSIAREGSREMLLPDVFNDAQFDKLFAEVAAELNVALPSDCVRLEPLSGGRSDVHVLQASFPVKGGTLRYVLRVHGLGLDHGTEAVLSAYRSEMKTLKELRLHAKKFLSREFVDKELWLHFAASKKTAPVTVLRHASDRQADTEPLDPFPKAVASVLSTGELTRLAAELSTAIPEINAEWRRIPGHDLPRVERTPTLASKLAQATLPDYVLRPVFCRVDVNREQLMLAENRTELDELLSATIEDEAFSSIVALETSTSNIARVEARVSVETRSVGNSDLFVQCVLPEGALAIMINAEQGQCLLDEHKSLARNTSLVFHRSLLKPVREVLAPLGIARDEVISTLDITRLLELRPLHVTHASHADMHCGNVMASETTVKVIDFYNPRFRLAHSDWARLTTSLVAELHQFLDADHNAELRGGDANGWLSNSPMASRVTELLEVLIGRVTDSSYGVCTAVAIEVSRYLRYVLEGAVAPSELFCAWCTHWAQAVAATLAETSPPEDAPVLYDLWEESLVSCEMGGLTKPASSAISAVAAKSGDRLVSPLSDLQTRYLQAIRSRDVKGANTLLLGPTSTGKSTIAQCILLGHLVEPSDSSRPCAIYIAPTKALTYAFYSEVKELVESAGLLSGTTTVVISTGDDREFDHLLSQGRFRIACVVNEKANAIFSRSPLLLSRLGLLVVDEMHMLQELQRGPVLETLLMKVRSEQFSDSERTRPGGSLGASIVPRVVGISTEQGNADLLRAFMEARDRDLRKVPPVTVMSPARPVAVQHSFVFRGSEHENPKGIPLVIEPIVRVSGETGRQLEERQILKVSHRLESIQGTLWRSADYRDLRGARHNMTIDLCKWLLTSMPVGRTLLVFTSSKRESSDLAKKIATWRPRLDADRKDDRKTRSPFAMSVDEMEAVEEAKALLEYAEAEIYIHNSEINTTVRHAIEELFAATQLDTPTRVLIATTTLAYGVNLAVTDVILEHTVFPTATRKPPARTSILDKTVNEDSIEPVEFHNMAGRAGRMGFGTSDANFFVIVPPGMDPTNEILIQYYGQRNGRGQASVRSVLFASDDKTPMAEIEERRSNQWLSISSEQDEHSALGTDSFSYPFARAVLDIARHLTYSNVRSSRSSENPLMPVTADDVMTFIATYSLLRHQTASSTVSAKREGEFLKQAVAVILRDCETLGLLESQSTRSEDESGELRAYTMRNMGEAMLETGTEFAAVVPMIELMTLIRKKWMAFFESHDPMGVDLPAEAFLLALVFQEEVCRRYRTAIPEWRSSRNEQQWDSAQREANEKFVISEFTEALGRALPKLGGMAGDLARSLRSELNSRLILGTFGPIRLGYDYAAVDGGLRFFASMVRWINGDRIDLCRGVLTREFDKAGVATKPQQFFGFADYVSRLSYRARFLAALSMDETRRRDPAGALQLERDILTVSERLVHGCVAEAVPLFWPRSSNLLRRQANELVGKGVSAQQIARNGVVATRDTNIGPKAQALVSDISSYASRELERLWSELRPRDVRNEDTVDFLNNVEGWVGYVCQIMKSSPQSTTNHGNTKEILQQFVGASELRARDVTIEMHPNYEDDENVALDRPVAKLAPIQAIEAYADEWAGSLLKLEGANPAMSLALIASPRQSLQSIQDALAQVIEQAPTATAVICVVWPWASASDFQERGFDDVTGSAGRRINCVCVTPLAYCALVTFVVRGFLPPTSLFGIADRGEGRLIGASALVDEFSLLDHKDIPGSLRRDLLAHFEVL